MYRFPHLRFVAVQVVLTSYVRCDYDVECKKNGVDPRKRFAKEMLQHEWAVVDLVLRSSRQ